MRAAVEAAVRRSGDPLAPEADRVALIELLGELGRTEDLPALTAIAQARGRARRSNWRRSVRWVISRSRRARGRLLRRYRSASPVVRDRILGLMCTRPAWTKMLLDAIDRGEIAAKDLTNAHVQTIAQLHDPALLARLESLWGKVPKSGSPQKKQRIAEIRGLLPEGDKGNAARGKADLQGKLRGLPQALR